MRNKFGGLFFLMTTEIITAIISAGAAIGGSWLVQNKTIAVLQTKLEDLKEDINKLSARVDSHNNFGLKIERLETKIETIEEELKRKD
jgi:peptidoglycan hydrolase CwlO-like protein